MLQIKLQISNVDIMMITNSTAAILLVEKNEKNVWEETFSNTLSAIAKNFDMIEIKSVSVALTCDSKMAKTIEILLKRHEYVFLFVEIMDPLVLSELNYHLSKVFNQAVVHKQVDVLEHAKILSGSYLEQMGFVMYNQGLLLITPLNMSELLISNFVQPFLKRRIVRKQFMKLLYFDQKASQFELPVNDKLDVQINAIMEFPNFKIEITSESIAKLISVENWLKLRLEGSFIKEISATDIVEDVYSYNFSYAKDSIDIIEECFDKYGPKNVLIAFNGGKDCMVLLHLSLAILKNKYKEQNVEVHCLYVQSTDSFKELDEFVEQCRQFYGLNMFKFKNNMKFALESVLKMKPNIKACLMGTRRNDPFAQDLNVFQMTDIDWPQIMRVSPLLNWNYAYIWDYLLDLQVPYCILYDQGFTSIGGCSNTKPNPSLWFFDTETESGKYLPAYKLFDASKERNGRGNL